MSSTLEYIFNHVFLPLKLPQHDDYDERFSTSSDCENWEVIINMIANLLQLKTELELDQPSRIKTMTSMLKTLEENSVLLIPIRAQNACVLIKTLQEETVFETFEVDPPNKVVMGTAGRIVRSFPDASITIPSRSISSEFKDELASFLIKMDEDVLEDSAAHSKKAGERPIEVRDTADPHYITGLLMAILSGLKGSSPGEIKGIVKHTRNDILWRNAYKPWRRSPSWLAIRVAIQLTLHQLGCVVEIYKRFMAYFAAELLSSEGLDSLPGDMIFCAQSKLGHRMRKLDEAHSSSAILTEKVLRVTEEVHAMLQHRWKEIRERQLPTANWAPSQLDFEADTQISLLHSRTYLYGRVNKIEAPRPSSLYTPPQRHRLFSLSDPYQEFNEGALTKALREDRTLSLAEIEAFVLEHLADLDLQQQPLDAANLSECIEIYIEFAQDEYKNNPETLSIMILTVFILWMTLDKLTILRLPLLKEYSPEIPTSLLNPILLSTSLHIERYIMFQRYIADRHQSSNTFLPSIFDNQAVHNSFAIRHFASSEHLQDLKAQIEASAAQARKQKLQELTQKKAQQSSLLRQAEALDHTYNYLGNHRPKKCSKCRLQNKAKQLTIDVHEWPLPTNDLHANWTVFECRAPAEFRNWRGITYNILCGLCRQGLAPPKTAKAQCVLLEYKALSWYASTANLVTIASDTKSFIKSHYHSLKVSDATESSVCVKNGLNFRLYDSQRSYWIKKACFDDCTLDEMCMWKLSSPGTYMNLSYALRTNTHESPNRSIADQFEAPTNLDLHEHVNFGNLRSGSRLQWMNILRELHTRTLSFSRQEVQFLVLLAGLQAGPVTHLGLEWHGILTDQGFAMLLLNEVESMLENIRENWAQNITLETLILLTLRLLGSQPPVSFSHILKVLHRARQISYDWMQILFTRLLRSADSSSDSITAELDVTTHIAVSAALCRLTYNVDAHHLHKVFKHDKDIAMFVECSIRLHDNIPSGEMAPQLSRLLARDSRLLNALHSKNYFPVIISNHQGGLHGALKAVWDAYTRGSDWQLLHSGQPWVTSRLQNPASEYSLSIHLDLKSGTLLVDGRPLGRLPKTITGHDTYKRLLGNRVLDAIPSLLPGSDFATRDHIGESGFQLHFRLVDTTLVITSTKGSRSYELVPHETLDHDFPALFVNNFTHWLYIDDGIPHIEFRPLHDSWEPSSSNWNLVFSSKTLASATLKHGADPAETGITLIDIHSNTYRMVSSVLRPLETMDFTHVTWSPKSPNQVTITLPRYKLSFTLRDGELHSDNFSEMIIDRNRSCGTLYGLQNTLTLRSIARTRDYSSKRSLIIIPYGQVAIKQEKDHITVDVQKAEEALVIQYFKYDIDLNLRSLVGTTLLSELYRIYLHAITSHFLPDPLFQHTGTEEAVCFLRSSRCKSFQSLTDQEEGLLLQIAQLAPSRAWYPESLRVMQSVKWLNISPFSQHWSFPVLVDGILEHAERISLFSNLPNKNKRGDRASCHGHLEKRSLSHNLHLMSPWDHIQNLKHFRDSIYSPLHSANLRKNNSPLRSQIGNASSMSMLVQQWPKNIETNCDPWELLSAASQPLHKDWAGFSLTYDNRFLNLEISEFWLPFYSACIFAQDEKVCKAQLAFTLPAIAYQLNDTDVVSSLLAFAIYTEFRSIHPPQWDTYDLSHGCSPDLLELITLINRHARWRGCVYCIYDGTTHKRDESQHNFDVRRSHMHKAKCEEDTKFLASFLVNQWRIRQSSDLVLPNINDYGHIDLSTHAIAQLEKILATWYSNTELKTKFALPIHAVLRKHRPLARPTNPPQKTQFSVPTSLSAALPKRECATTSLMDLLCQKLIYQPVFQTFPISHLSLTIPTEPIRNSATTIALSRLLDEFINHKDSLHVKYGRSIQESYKASNTNIQPNTSTCSDYQFADLFHFYKEQHQNLLEEVRYLMLPHSRDFTARIQAASFHYPKINIKALLALWHEVATSHRVRKTTSIEMIIRSLALSLVHLQRSQRLGFFWLLGHLDEVARELAHEPRLDSQSIDWLLIQIQGNFLARSLQIDVTKKMISPENGNTVIQLNMGEGKTSVIVPLVASHLADGKKLARVVVLKPLAKAMFSLLVERLSGLVNRRIFYFPFSRAVDVTPMRSQQLRELFDLCLKERGVLVTQPEHVLSFRLMGIDLIKGLNTHPQSDSESTVEKLLQNQQWLTECSRDILDESDEILNVKYQLVYTSGRQAPIENHPRRWLEIQTILSLVSGCVRKTHSIGGELDGFNVECENAAPAQFPIIRILDSNTGNTLSNYAATALLNDVKFRFLPKRLYSFALQFISNRTVEENKKNELYEGLTPELWGSLLLYRGFCAFGILDHLFREKRWRVNYGLHPARTLLAVPYRAKDVPAPRADFGHPDVAISLTCLSYYYGGLTKDQIEETVQLLFKLDDPSQEYSRWTAGVVGLSASLQDVVGINLDDAILCDKLHKAFKRNRATIDFYLANVVFPREAKQFPKKLTTSAWDLAEEKTHPTTGFSGTNDNQDLLPLSIVQRDPVGQLGTNARVLECLLQQENDRYLLVCREDNQILLSEDYLTALTKENPKIRVLLDVGAQMLDKRNDEISSRWLDLQPEAEAAVFFDDDDSLVVMTRDKCVEAFEVSTYSQRLECCLVYLDDAHTRGTDLKLPRNYRAAVTLGMGLNKDRLVQGCMRMRKLGVGQSVMFFAPHEVDAIIRRLAKKQDGERIHTVDVLRWAMTETCNSIRQNIPRWVQQSLDYKRRNEASARFWKECSSRLTADKESISAFLALREGWEDDDARSLEVMYGSPSEIVHMHPAFEDPNIRLHLANLGVHSLSVANLDEEQEREVHHEAEQERHVERPPAAQPAEDDVDDDVRYLVKHGVRKDSSAFVPMFSPLAFCDKNNLSWSQNLWSTKACATTIATRYNIQLKSKGKKKKTKQMAFDMAPRDVAEYQRPVYWLLTSKIDPSIVSLSPYEVDVLLPIIRKSTFVHLHMYAPRVNQAMDTLEDLTYFAIPPLPASWTPPSAIDIAQLNLWAGQLYLKDIASYETLCMVLGIVGERSDSEELLCELDGFVPPQYRTGRMKEVCAFATSPLPFLRELIGLRQKGKSYQSTHMGKILDGRLLTEKDFLS